MSDNSDEVRAVEKAAGQRGHGTFPDSWGIPPGTAYSDERRAWIRHNVVSRRGQRMYDVLVRKDIQHVHMLRMAVLASKKAGPSSTD